MPTPACSATAAIGASGSAVKTARADSRISRSLRAAWACRPLSPGLLGAFTREQNTSFRVGFAKDCAAEMVSSRVMNLGRIGIWNVGLRSDDPRMRGEIQEAAAELEELGYGAIWLGGSPGVA